VTIFDTISARLATATEAREAVGIKRSGKGSRFPASFRGNQYIEVGLFVLVVALVIPTITTSSYTENLVNLWLLYSLAAIGFYIIFGLAGQFAFSQAFVMGLAAYLSAWVTKFFPVWTGMLIAVVVVAIVAFVFALITLRTSHFYFAIATFGLSSIGLLVIKQWGALGGSGGQVVGIPVASWFGKTFASQNQTFWLFLAFLTLGLLVTSMLERSVIRREALALKDNETVATTLGLAVQKHRIMTFVIGSCFGAVAGSLYAHWQTVLSTDAFSLDLGTGIFLMVILGGLGSKWGSVIGAGFYVFVPQWLDAAKYQQLLYGALLVVIIMVCPEGLIGLLWRGLRIVGSRVSYRPLRHGAIGPPPEPGSGAGPEPKLNRDGGSEPDPAVDGSD
jgi:branched-chain amino acid transport system permease protein